MIVLGRANDVTSWKNFGEISGVWVSMRGLLWESYDGGGYWNGCY